MAEVEGVQMSQTQTIGDKQTTFTVFVRAARGANGEAESVEALRDVGNAALDKLAAKPPEPKQE